MFTLATFARGIMNKSRTNISYIIYIGVRARQRSDTRDWNAESHFLRLIRDELRKRVQGDQRATEEGLQARICERNPQWGPLKSGPLATDNPTISVRPDPFFFLTKGIRTALTNEIQLE